jgi:hypothetical protein
LVASNEYFRPASAAAGAKDKIADPESDLSSLE